MATTRIIAMHRNKGCTAKQALKARLDYIKNPEKTREGELVTAFACHAATADAEFALARKEYFEITGRWQENEVIAYQIRQSFKPGEAKIPSGRELQVTFEQTLVEKRDAYAAYWAKQREWREMMVVKGNVEQVLKAHEQQDKTKAKETLH